MTLIASTEMFMFWSAYLSVVSLCCLLLQLRSLVQSSTRSAAQHQLQHKHFSGCNQCHLERLPGLRWKISLSRNAVYMVQIWKTTVQPRYCAMTLFQYIESNLHTIYSLSTKYLHTSAQAAPLLAALLAGPGAGVHAGGRAPPQQ